MCMDSQLRQFEHLLWRGHCGVYLLKEKLTSVPGTHRFYVEVQPAKRGARLATGVNESFATDLEGSRISPLTIQ